MKNKNILYLRTDIAYSKVIAGGGVTHTLEVIKGFLKLGHNVVCASSILQEQIEATGAKLKSLSNPKIIMLLRWKLNCILSNIFFTWQALSIFKKHKFDFIYQRYLAANCSGVILSKFKKIPLVLEYNGSDAWVMKNWNKKNQSNWFYKIVLWIENINIKHATHIVVVSKPLKEELVNRGVNPNKILVNPNGVDTDVCDPAKFTKIRETLRNNLGWQNKFVYGFVGTFSIWHGIDVIKKIMYELLSTETDVCFMMIGDGPLLKDLKLSINNLNIDQSRVLFTGIVPPDKAKEYLSCCDAFLSPTQPNTDGSKFFGSPTKLFEYMSFAKPIIASDLDQISELIYPALKIDMNFADINDSIGCLIDPTKHTDFVWAAKKMIKSEKKALNLLGNNARNRALVNHQWQNHVYKIISFVFLSDK